ncbi:MAG TPA: hypothetical protein VNO32_26445 [Candidatus Acidoferrum sp.]|jgi:hypothetical protein|nr:hypothetical protein [Candidatus Acidoferrum sp.]
MTTDSKFPPRNLTASEYVRELFGPEDNAAILVRNRSTRHTVQTIAKAEAIASPDFQSWLAGQNASGYDVFMGMNPIKDGASRRTKGDITDIRHVYLDLDRQCDQALEAIRNSNAVARGDHVEEIIRRIVDYRGDEKHTNYARYTVEKARLGLRGPAAALESAERSPTHAIEPSHEP